MEKPHDDDGIIPDLEKIPLGPISRSRTASSEKRLRRIESVRLKTLGEGPSAPDATCLVAASQNQDQNQNQCSKENCNETGGLDSTNLFSDKDEYVDPDWRGWFNLLGVGFACLSLSGFTSRTVF